MRINFAFTQSQPPAPVVPQDSPRPGRAPAYLPNPCPARPEGSSFATTAQVTAQVCSGLPSPSCPRKVPASVRITRSWKVNVLPSPSSFVADEDHLCAGSPISRFPQSQLPAPVLPQDSPRPCLAPAYRPNPCPARLEGLCPCRRTVLPGPLAICSFATRLRTAPGRSFTIVGP